MTPTPAQPGRQAVRQEMEQARQAFHDLLDHATVADLRRPSHEPGGPTSNCCSTCCSGTWSSAHC